MTDSQTLLAEYVRTGSETAFRELVVRYVDLVHSTALRLVEGDTHRAEDVAQTVFMDLARMARTLSSDVMLGGWLHRHTCFVAANTMRGERRRQSRERQAVEMNALQSNPDTDFSLVAPFLDEAINELGDADRTAVLLRFFEQHDFRSVGEALGSNEDAARMRVTRALEKLEHFLKRRGVTTSAATLGLVLGANAVQAAPVGLAVTISTAAALTGATIATTATATAIKTIAMTTLQKTIIGTTLAIAVGAGVYEAQQASTLKAQLENIQQQQSPFAEQLKQLNGDYTDATNRIAALRDDNERLNNNTLELLKLRDEVRRLRNDSQELAALKASGGTRAGITEDSTQTQMKAWLARVDQVKQRFEQTPGAKIPELQFLLEHDWVDATAGNYLKSEDDFLKAITGLKLLAATRYGIIVQAALSKYTKANNGQFPGGLSELEPYFKNPAESTILQRYQIIPGINLANDASELGDWAITQKEPMDEKENVRIAIGSKTIVQGYRAETDGALDAAVRAYSAANNGGLPKNINELKPYIGTPAEKAAFEKRVIFDQLRKTPSAVPIINDDFPHQYQ